MQAKSRNWALRLDCPNCVAEPSREMNGVFPGSGLRYRNNLKCCNLFQGRCGESDIHDEHIRVIAQTLAVIGS